MALFGKLFEKKVCDICGEEIGLLGNRKLEDGNCCKACAAKLSPWFDERRHSTVESIREQIEYREENLRQLESFHTTRTISSDRFSILLDEDQQKFVVMKNRTKLLEYNPDILDFSQVTGARLDVDSSRHEIMREVKRGDQTERVSYNPPRYEYSYDFHYIINVNHPYFDDIRFDLNNSNVEITPAYGGGMIRGTAPQPFDPSMNPEYQEYERIGKEITDVLMGARSEARAAKAEEQNPSIVTCPFCGAQTAVTSSGKCEYCGGYVGPELRG